MRIYTRKGDEGFTYLLDGSRVRKDDSRIEAIGAIDELNSMIGWALSAARKSEHIFITNSLKPVQHELFVLGARIGSLGTSRTPPDLPAKTIDRMEREMDTVCDDLQPLAHFILPTGSELAGRLHLSRSAGRRAERRVVSLLNPTDRVLLLDPIALKYLNRLNDLLFSLARLANRDASEADVPRADDRQANP